MTSNDLIKKDTLTFIIELLREEGDVIPPDLNTINWEELYEYSVAHKVAPIIFSKILKFKWAPDLVSNRMRAFVFRNKQQMLKLYAEQKFLKKSLNEHGINHLFLKGPDLSQRLHEDFSRRQCKDLDLYVNENQLDNTLNVLKDLGYMLHKRYHQTPKQQELVRKWYHEYYLFQHQKGILVELHWHLLPPLYYSQNQRRLLGENLTTGKVNVLTTEDELIYLCVHGAHHRWKRLIWSYDIYHYLKRCSIEDLEAIYEKSLNLKAVNAFLEMLQIQRELYHVEIPHSLADKFTSGTSKLVRIARLLMKHQRKLQAADLKDHWFHFLGTYYLGGIKMIVGRARGFFIQPGLWNLYYFGDRWFFFNYLAAPFLSLLVLFRRK